MSSKKTHPMDKEAAIRIQSHADRTGTNQDFKARVQSTADRNANANAQTSGGTGGAAAGGSASTGKGSGKE